MKVDTLSQLVRAVSHSKTRGYDVTFNIQPDRKGYGGFLVIRVSDNDPDTRLNGEWWFDSENGVMQVL